MWSAEAGNPLVKNVNIKYSKQLLQFNDFDIVESTGVLHKVKGFDNYNQLLNINGVFSNQPCFDPVDRTNQCLGPIVFSPSRPWRAPTVELSLEAALEQRVTDICSTGQKINLLWSGGIDSTTIVVAFLKNAPHLNQCRILYSPWSTYEHPDFFNLLKSLNNIELVDISGEFYLTCDLDGIFVSGNTGDEIHASLDQSFFEQYGHEFLFTPWKDFFYSKRPEDQFIEFCEQHFVAAGRDIHTVLDARWWFYASSKLTSILNNNDLAFFTAVHSGFDPARLIGFFDCDAYEQFIYFNIDKLICSDNYATWRQFLKDYCYQYDGFDDWRTNKKKFSSTQMKTYTFKKKILNDARNLLLLDNGQRVTTPLLPLFSKSEWEPLKQRYQHVFRSPNSV
jgi:hypothetical protein